MVNKGLSVENIRPVANTFHRNPAFSSQQRRGKIHRFNQVDNKQRNAFSQP